MLAQIPYDGVELVAYSFTGGVDGANPLATLIYVGSIAYILYGTTENGGAFGKGVIFSFNISTGVETVLYSFAGGNDGANPSGALLSLNSKFYGTTAAGGPSGVGTVFMFDPATGTETVLHSFNGSDGGDIRGGVIEAGNLLYGTSYKGGASHFGTVFSLRP